MLFFKSKTLSHRQTAMIGFVLAIISLLVTAFTVFVFPLFGAWLNVNGVYDLDLFLLGSFSQFSVHFKGFWISALHAQEQEPHIGFKS